MSAGAWIGVGVAVAIFLLIVVMAFVNSDFPDGPGD